MRARPWLWVLAAALAVSVLLAPFASSWPDGLEKVAEALGFARRAQVAPPVAAPLPDYQVPGVPHPHLSTALAGALGTVLVFALVYAAARLIAGLAARRHADSPR
jgi:cobalt/nickel transport protein